tara:strand:+ start:1190 stop:1297 length:108 start_codon:yes stop_codon:yes gene_type:complete
MNLSFTRKVKVRHRRFKTAHNLGRKIEKLEEEIKI